MGITDEDVSGYALPGVAIALCTVLHAFTPAFSVSGYVVDDTGNALVYRQVQTLLFAKRTLVGVFGNQYLNRLLFFSTRKLDANIGSMALAFFSSSKAC